MAYKTLVAASAGLAIALTGCNRTENTAANEMAANDMAAVDTANDMALSAQQPTATADFVQAAAASDLYEIEAGKLAAEKGSSQAIKDFGAMLQADHKSSTEQLKAAVGETPTTMPVPELTPEQKDMLDTLKATNGAGFDKAFLGQQVTAHQKALDMLNTYAASGTDVPIRQFATKAGPVVQSHLDKAKSLQK